MAKIHTRVRRKFDIRPRFSRKNPLNKEGKKKGPKTFKTKEKAEAHAKKLGLKEYKVVPAKKGKKFKVKAK